MTTEIKNSARNSETNTLKLMNRKPGLFQPVGYRYGKGNTMPIAARIEKRIQIMAALLAVVFLFGTAAHASVNASPSSLNFGTVATGSTSASHTVTITNWTRNRTSIVSLATSAAQFQYSGPSLPFTLRRGQSVTVSVTFAPTVAQTYSGALTITRGNGDTTTVGLGGIGSSPNVAPTITTQPASAKIITGQSATFNVAATGTSPITYQWKKNGAPLSGATSSTYTTPAVTMTDNNAQFSVAVSNPAGNANSNAAVLTITAAAVAPAITTQPASQTVVAGKTASFSVGASGTAPMTYQWKKNGTAISGATAATYTTPAETTADNSAQFTVAVSNSAGSASSNAAILTVNASTLLLNSSVSSLSFGSVNVSSTGTKTVTLTNAGNANVSISNVTVTGAGFNATGVNGMILTPGQAATLTATFIPSTAGSVTGNVSVASNASNSPDSIALSGTGVAVVNHSVSLSWIASASSVVGYNTYSSTQQGGPYTKMTNAPVAATSYTDSAVQTGSTYFFVVTSVDASNVESAFSNEVSALVP
jgi:hypothetical protein